MVVIGPARSMFWGVAVDAGKRYSQIVNQSFHLSMAALEPGSAPENEYVQVMIHRDSSEFLVCSLKQGLVMQQSLDLLFASGEELSFSLVGKAGTVHLTGYVVDEDYPSDDDDDVPELVEMKSGSKRKAMESGIQPKKQRLLESFDDNDSDDDEDDDDFEEDDEDDSDDEDSDDEDDFSEDELTFDEDEGSGFGEDSDEDDVAVGEDEDDEHVVSSSKKTVVTPKGDNVRSLKKDKQTPKTPLSAQKKNAKTPQTPNTSQNKTPSQGGKSPQTPGAEVNGESASAKKKKKKKKNKSGDSSMNQSTTGTPDKSSSESTPKSAKKGGESSTPKVVTPGKKRVVAGGTVVEDLKVGHGPEARPGKMVSVYYVGTLTSNSKRFDSCTGGKPFRFRLKQGEVIKGWDNGVEGMKVGGKRKIVVPPNQGYGGQKQGPIPANSSLTFEVELKAVS